MTRLSIGSLLAIATFVLTSCGDPVKQYSVDTLSCLPALDGEEDACWNDVKQEPIDGDIAGKLMWNGEKDLSATFRCGLREENLYFFITAKDDILRSYDDSVVAFYEHDNIQFFFSQRNKKKSRERMDASDSIFYFCFTFDKERIVKIKSNAIDARFAQKRTQDGWNVEVLMPIPKSYRDSDNKIGFNIELTDNDNVSAEEGLIRGRETTIAWTANSAKAAWAETVNYGELLLK